MEAMRVAFKAVREGVGRVSIELLQTRECLRFLPCEERGRDSAYNDRERLLRL
jgi:hypothetical protein